MFEWDEAKRARNLAKHGVDFESVWDFGWEDAVRYPDERRDYGEARRIALGYIGKRLHVCVYTERGGAIRLISLRRANAREEAFYEKETATTH